MAKHFKKMIQIRFREADPARILYFGNIFSLAHDCFEDFIQAAGFQWKEWFSDPAVIVPIRHTECDFLIPFLPGDTYEIQASVKKLGETSFQMQYEFKNQNRTHAVVKMVHACLDAQTKQKVSVPQLTRERLAPFCDNPSGVQK